MCQNLSNIKKNNIIKPIRIVVKLEKFDKTKLYFM